jgi:hypothetical protein
MSLMIVCHLFNGLSHQINKIGDVVRVLPPIHSHALIASNITFEAKIKVQQHYEICCVNTK